MIRRLLACTLLLLLCSGLASAKRYIYIANDKDISFMEGWYRANSATGDVIVREKDGKKLLDDAWNKLVAGDELIICTHGQTQSSKPVGSLTLEGKTWAGFKVAGSDNAGTGACYDVYPLPALNLNNLTVRFKVCYAGGIPPGVGKKSVQASMVPCITGTGTTYEAHNKAVRTGYGTPKWVSTAGNGTEDQRVNARWCLFLAAVASGYPMSDKAAFQKWLGKRDYDSLESVNTYLANHPCSNDPDSIDTWKITFPYSDPIAIDAPQVMPAFATSAARGPSDVTKPEVEEAIAEEGPSCADGLCFTVKTRTASWGRLRQTYR